MPKHCNPKEQRWHYRCQQNKRSKKQKSASKVLISCVAAIVVVTSGMLFVREVFPFEAPVPQADNPNLPIASEPIVSDTPPLTQTNQDTASMTMEELAKEEPITQEEAQELDTLLDSMPGSVSVWLMDIATGQTYTYQPQIDYYCASTLKAPYALWLSQKDEADEIDLTTAWNSSSYWDLVYKMIANSDNDATYTLGNKWPANQQTGFQEFLAQLGFSNPASCEILQEGIHGRMTAEDGGKAMEALYEYFETQTDDAQKLQAAFLDANHDLLWLPDVAAKKYGSWDSALHDMAIVYAERPYIISVFTNWGDTDVDFPPEGTARMQQIGQLVADVILD